MRPNGLIFIMVLALLLPFQASAQEVKDYSSTIEVFKSFPAVQPFFKNSYGYAVFPTVGKAAFIVGGAYGEGQVYRNGKVTGKSHLMHASLGLQLGGKAFSEIVFFENKQAYDAFTSGSFEFDANASAVAVTAGVQAKASTTGNTASATAGPKTGAQADTVYRKGMITFVHARGGLMAGLSVGGQKFNFDPL